MKQTELRIGNYIRATLAVLDDMDINQPEFTERTIKDGKDIDNAKWFEPIPLTDEWLLKFGFDNSEPESWKKDDFEFFTVIVGKKIPNHLNYRGIGIWNTFLNGEFKVHQLQNLYYALTGTELTIKQ